MLNAETAENAEVEAEPMNRLSQELIGAAIEVHRELGPGLLESTYEHAFSRELTIRGIEHVRQYQVSLRYKGSTIEAGYRLDVLVDRCVVVELKAVEKMVPLFGIQLLTYLRLGGYPLGLLINFNVPKLVDGIERVSNLAPNLSPRTPRPPR